MLTVSLRPWNTGRKERISIDNDRIRIYVGRKGSMIRVGVETLKDVQVDRETFDIETNQWVSMRRDNESSIG